MNNKIWVNCFLIVVASTACILYAVVSAFLHSNFESNEYSQIVNRQQANNSIYGTALNSNTFYYKLELIKQVKPKIISLGSSRVMQFRKDGFKTSFSNAGGAMNHLNEGAFFTGDV